MMPSATSSSPNRRAEGDSPTGITGVAAPPPDVSPATGRAPFRCPFVGRAGDDASTGRGVGTLLRRVNRPMVVLPSPGKSNAGAEPEEARKARPSLRFYRMFRPTELSSNRPADQFRASPGLTSPRGARWSSAAPAVSDHRLAAHGRSPPAAPRGRPGARRARRTPAPAPESPDSSGRPRPI